MKMFLIDEERKKLINPCASFLNNTGSFFPWNQFFTKKKEEKKNGIKQQQMMALSQIL